MDKAEFYQYAERYKDTIYRVALNYMRNPCDADDAVQEVLLKLYMTGTRFKGEEHVKRWLIRVTLNLCSNMLRSRGRREQVPVDELALGIPFEAEEQLALFTAVMSLAEKYRTVLYLFYYEDYTAGEIADILNLKVSAVTTRLSRARNLLRTQFLEGDTDGR
ncbi:MAG: RNA polymerase sigma factor [Oscillospiraceae bacterium]